jgi:hypothetical protein
MGLERIKRELTSHFVIESPCPPDLTLGVGRFDSSRAAPAGKIVAREEVQTRAYDSSFAGVSTRSFNERDWRPESARRIFKSSLASDFQVQGEVTHRPVIKVVCDRTVSQLSTSSLTPSTEPFHSHVAKIQVPETIAISHDVVTLPAERQTQKRHLTVKSDPLDGTDLQPVCGLSSRLPPWTYINGHRHGKRHFHIRDAMSHDDVPLPPNANDLPTYPQPRRTYRKAPSAYVIPDKLSLAWD